MSKIDVVYAARNKMTPLEIGRFLEKLENDALVDYSCIRIKARKSKKISKKISPRYYVSIKIVGCDKALVDCAMDKLFSGWK